MLSDLLGKWRAHTQYRMRILRVSRDLKSKVDHSRKQRGFHSFTNGITKLRSMKTKDQTATAFYNTRLLAKGISIWKQVKCENIVETRKVTKIRNMINNKLIIKYWEFMLAQSHDKRVKIRTAKRICRLPIKVEYRKAVSRWKSVVMQERSLEMVVEQGMEHFRQKRLSWALTQMQQNHAIIQERKELCSQVNKYYFKRQATQIFTMFKIFLEISREEREKTKTAMNFRKFTLLNKAHASWKIHMKNNHELYVKKKSVVKRLRKLKCPEPLLQWRVFASLSKSYHKSKAKADKCHNTALCVKSLASFKSNRVECKRMKTLSKQAEVFHLQNLVAKGLKSFVSFRTRSKLLREKRSKLESVIQKVDKHARMRTLMYAILEHKNMCKREHQQKLQILNLKKKQRVLNYMLYYKNKQIDLKCRYETLKEATNKRIKYRFILQWVRQYDIEWSIKEMKDKREHKLQLACFLELFKQLNLKKFIECSYLSKGFRGLVENLEHAKEKKLKIKAAKDLFLTNLQKRVINGLKYNLVVKQSVELMKANRLENYRVRAFNSLKWYWNLKSAQKEFTGLIQHRDLNHYFYAWYEKYDEAKVRREKLRALMDRKHHYDCLEAFQTWKKDSFFRTMVNLIGEFIAQPQEMNLMQDVFYAWRRAHEFEKVREPCEQLADKNSEYLSMRNTFKAWRSLSQPNMKLYMRIKNGINIIYNTMRQGPYFELIAISEKEKVKEKRVFYIRKQKDQQFKHRLFKAWKEAIEEAKQENQNVMLISHHMKAKSSSTHSAFYELESDSNNGEASIALYKPKFKLPVKLQIQTAIIKVFQGFSESTDQCLLRKYFIGMKFNLKLQKLRREQLEYSSKYYQHNL